MCPSVSRPIRAAAARREPRGAAREPRGNPPPPPTGRTEAARDPCYRVPARRRDPGAALGRCRRPRNAPSNPDLYRKSLRAATQAGKQYGVITADPDVERVNRIGYELASVAEFDKFPFTFSVVDMPIPHAFALPAGHIFVTRGLLDLGLDDDMLAGLLGHEHRSRQPRSTSCACSVARRSSTRSRSC